MILHKQNTEFPIYTMHLYNVTQSSKTSRAAITNKFFDLQIEKFSPQLFWFVFKCAYSVKKKNPAS